MLHKLSIIFVLSFVFILNANIALAVRVPAYVTDVNAPQPTVPPPNDPPWDYSQNVGLVTLQPGDHIWVGAYNKYDPNRSKSVSVRMKGFPGNLDANSVVGYEPNGTTVTGSTSVNGHFDSGKYTWFFSFYYPIQPAWEAIKIVNNDSNNNHISDINIWYTCYGSSNVENRSELNECSLGHSDHPAQITQILFAHTSANTNPGVPPTLTVSDPGEIWVDAYITHDEDGDPLPQGGWLWTCVAGDGIAAEEKFDISLTTEECLPQGGCMLHVFDELTMEWSEFPQLPMAEPQANPADINRDCIVNFGDFAEFALHWLKEY
ncbi:MAG: hypothetical protein JW806_08165 [Sedimentisphaerales bacterium]|nr:hypothetical protein [Sedimentisphaerales bacterium]